MATNFGNVALPVSFNPQTAFPLDKRGYFESLAAAQSAAATAGVAGSDSTIYYFGQLITVFENNTVANYEIIRNSNGVGELKQIDATVEPGDLPLANGTTTVGALKLDANSGLSLVEGILALDSDSKAAIAAAASISSTISSALAELVNSDTGTAGAGKYVSQVTQTNGQVSVVYAELPTYEAVGTAQSLIDALNVSDEGTGIVTGVSESKGKISVTKRALTESDIPELSQSKITGLETALSGKQDALEISPNYDANTSKIASMGDIDAAIQGLGQALSYAGVADQDPSAGNVTTVNSGTAVTITAGKVVSFGNKEYLCTSVSSGTQHWKEFGDEGAYVVKNAAITAQTTAALKKLTFDTKGLITGSEDVSASDIPELPTSKITGLDTELAKLVDLHTHSNKSVLDGITSEKVAAWDSADENVIESITVNGTSATITNKAASVNIDSLIADSNGKVYGSVNGTKKELVFKESLGSLATKNKVGLTDLDTDVNESLSDINTSLSNHETRIETIESTLTTLAGAATVSGSVAHAEATAQSAKDKADANETAIGNLGNLIGTLPEGQTSVVDYVASAVAGVHTHSNKALLDTYTQTESDLADAVSKKHTHSNKELLDTYDQTNANIADAVSKRHEHANASVLSAITSTDVTNWNNAQSNAISTVTGTAQDTSSASTIYGAKAYAAEIYNTIKDKIAAIEFDKDEASTTIYKLASVVEEIINALNPPEEP